MVLRRAGGESGVNNSLTRIRILRIWRRTFHIHANTDNPNPILCGCRVGYRIGKIRRIWIIRNFYADYPMFKIGYPKVSLPRLKNLGFKKVC